MPTALSTQGPEHRRGYRRPGPDGRLRWSDPNVSDHRAYRYQIALVDENDKTMSLSNAVIAKAYPGPAAPVDITAATQQRGVLIQWKATPKDIEGKPLDGSTLSFSVQRLSAAGVWRDVSPLVKGEAYYDQQVAPGQTNTYRVVSVRYVDEENVYGEPSSQITVQGPQAGPPPPPGRVWVVPAHGGLEVHWIEDEGKTAGYYVYRKQGKQIVRLTAERRAAPAFHRSRRKSRGDLFLRGLGGERHAQP